MGAVVLQVLHTEVSADWGSLRLARPASAPQERVLLWEGLPPGPAPDHLSLATVVLRGELRGRGAYAEAVPSGLRWSQQPPPDALRPYVVWRILEALVVLHQAHQVHGSVGPDRVVLGPEGEVVLVGRGRASAMARMDVLGAMGLLTDPEDTLPSESVASLAKELGERCSPQRDREALASWVRAVVPAGPPEILGTVSLTLAPEVDQGADEILPDLGTDTGGDGLLERWRATTGITPGETTAEVTDGGQRSAPDALALWSLLAASSEQRPPPHRFDAIQGMPSRGIQRLVATEHPASLPEGGHGSPEPSLPTPEPLSEDTAILPALRGPLSAPELVLAAAALAVVVWIALFLAGGL